MIGREISGTVEWSSCSVVSLLTPADVEAARPLEEDGDLQPPISPQYTRLRSATRVRRGAYGHFK